MYSTSISGKRSAPTKTPASGLYRSPAFLSANSTVSSTANIDPEQLLALCYKIRENIRQMDKGIKLIQLRFETLHYVCIDNGHDPWPTNCLSELVDLCKSSQVLVSQLDELHTKLNNDPLSMISFQIGSQQLAFFTSEWFDELTPKFKQTLSLADKYINVATTTARGATKQNTLVRSDKLSALNQYQTLGYSSTASVELRVHDALVRLKQSMSENEHLIASISNNLDYTKTTIEAIYSSLQASKTNLDQGEKDVIESVGLVRSSFRLKFLFAAICCAIFLIIVWLLLRLLGII